jgi:Calcineurin-like phosphoesterase
MPVRASRRFGLQSGDDRIVAPATTAGGAKPSRYRYIFNSGSAPALVRSYGWNLIDVDSQEEVEALPAGTRGLYWIGDYDNASCGWEVSDATLRRKVSAVAGNRKLAGYFFSDEPDPYRCPAAPAEHRARTKLIHALDPAKFTIMVSDSNSGRVSLNQIPLWAGAADYIGFNPYPCYVGKPCDYAWIATIIRAANRARFPYWGVVQAFADDEWRWPTPAEERHMLSQWSHSRQRGYMTFAWTWAGHLLTGQKRLIAVLKHFNGGSIKRRFAGTVDEVHYSFTGPRSVAFVWRGTARVIRYGRSSRYGKKAQAHRPAPAPFSSAGPFWEVRLNGLRRGTTYHYSIGGGRDHIFATAPTGSFRFDVEGDVGDSRSSSRVRSTQTQIAADKPAFVLVSGDLTYGNDEGLRAVDQHFNDVMAWSWQAAYMPAWGNHEWGEPDGLANYKGRFAIPHARASPGAPRNGCCGEDWGWFDAGPVRFISYPEPYSDATWSDWRVRAGRLIAAAQADRRIRFVVTFGHRPAYSTGYHSGEGALASTLNEFGDRYPKYVLNLNAHSHDYERFHPIHGVVHVTAAGGGASLEGPWRRTDPRSAFRAMHLEHLRVDVTPARIRIQALCGPATAADDISCRAGEVIDSYTIGPRQ